MSIGRQPQPAGASQENHEKMKGLFVEIGFRRSPVIEWGNKKFEKDEKYLGLELDAENVKEFSSKYKDNPNIQFKRIEGNQDEFHFPLPDGIADEVHIANVFGIPGAVDSHNLQLLLEESIRILKKGGVLSVLESLAPNYSKEQFEHILKLFNFKITVSITPYSPEWQQAIAEYQDYADGRNWDIKRGLNDSYYLIKAEKQS
jgi:ubiquinone/menaquinone biosynthesis C-methylase UbiE